MALCPICGCKTDELDFVNEKIADTDVKMCSFCQRQVRSFDEGKEPGDGHIRWLASVADKMVPERSEAIDEYLKALKDKFVSREIAETVAKPSHTAPIMTNTANTDESQAELLERIEALETELKAFKRSIRIKSILEVCIPIILAIILVLVFMSSDLFDSLSELYGFFVE